MLYILGDGQDNQVSVAVDRSGLIRVRGNSDCYYQYSSIRRIVAKMGAGNDQLSFVGSLAHTLEPIALDLRLDQDDDRLSIQNWQGSLHSDLGAGDDQADLTYAGGGTPDTSTFPMQLTAVVGLSSLELNVVAGLGDDVVNVSAAGFVDIVFEIDLGDGDDQANVDILPRPTKDRGEGSRAAGHDCGRGGERCDAQLHPDEFIGCIARH